MRIDKRVFPTRYRTRHFFNYSNTYEDIATKFEQEYVRCVRNEEECVCSPLTFRCNILISGKIIKEMPGSVASGKHCSSFERVEEFQYLRTNLTNQNSIQEETKS